MNQIDQTTIAHGELRAGFLTFICSLVLLFFCGTSSAATNGVPAEVLKMIPRDLLYVRTDIDDAENAFPLWAKAAGKFVPFKNDPDSDEIFFQAWSEKGTIPEGSAKQDLLRWLEENREALDLLDTGLIRETR